MTGKNNCTLRNFNLSGVSLSEWKVRVRNLLQLLAKYVDNSQDFNGKYPYRYLQEFRQWCRYQGKQRAKGTFVWIVTSTPERNCFNVRINYNLKIIAYYYIISICRYIGYEDYGKEKLPPYIANSYIVSEDVLGEIVRMLYGRTFPLEDVLVALLLEEGMPDVKPLHCDEHFNVFYDGTNTDICDLNKLFLALDVLEIIYSTHKYQC